MNVNHWQGIGRLVASKPKFCCLLGLSLLLGVACAPLPPYTIQAVFQASELEPYSAPGTATISGSAFGTTVGGEVKLAAGREIVLFPDTPYFREYYLGVEQNLLRDPAITNFGLIPGVLPPPPMIPDEAKSYIKKTRADASGNFEFANLPAGNYLIYSYIVWGVPSGYGGHYWTGGLAVLRATVGNGETKKVVLSR